ncbi:MAG TPA: hypothetical protein DD738_13875 [Ruminiclostridium sp.]|nr:hypothetical protein [Ruminiclostridium sp.]
MPPLVSLSCRLLCGIVRFHGGSIYIRLYFYSIPSIKKLIVKEADTENISIFILKNVLETGRFY